MQELDKGHEDILLKIKEKIVEITAGESGMIVYLRDAVYNEYNRGSSHNVITISCVFINEDGNLCADLFRSGSGGFMECLYGNIVSSIGPKGIDVINSALKEGRWYISETPKDDSGDKNKNNKKKSSTGKRFHLPFRFYCMMKGF